MADDPLANDVAQHWKENENDAIKTGTSFNNPSKRMDHEACSINNC
jgi:hypothetical protein